MQEWSPFVCGAALPPRVAQHEETMHSGPWGGWGGWGCCCCCIEEAAGAAGAAAALRSPNGSSYGTGVVWTAGAASLNCSLVDVQLPLCPSAFQQPLIHE